MFQEALIYMTQEKDQSSLANENDLSQPIAQDPVNTNNDKIDNINNPKQSSDSIFYDNMIFPS